MTVPNQFPTDVWSRIFVRGKFIDMTGTPMKGQVQFATNVTGGTLLDRASKLIISSRPYQANLDDNGYFEIQLPATNDPDITPTSFTYSVKEPTGRAYSIVVPFDTPPLSAPGDPLNGKQVIDLIDVVPAPGASSGVGQLIRGVGVSSVDIDGDGNLIVTYSDGSTHNAGFIPAGGGGSVPDATTTVKGKAVLLGGTADNPTVPWTAVTDRPSTLPPSGSAGGVLSGTYPSPGFATDMATQAELDSAKAELQASKAEASVVDALAVVASTGSYTDLTDTPEIPVLPTLAEVATSGSYTDLSDRPAIPAAPQDVGAQPAGDYISGDGGEMTGALSVNVVSSAADLVLGLPGAADSGINIRSSFAGGEDNAQPGTFDSTGRINLESYQRASSHSYGEVVRVFNRKVNAKSMFAVYFPSGGYDANGDPVGNFHPVVWHGAHWAANDGLSNHKHWSVETPDPTGAIQTRFEIRFGDPTVNDAVAGLSKTMIATNLADLVVRTTNGQELRLSSPAGNPKPITWSNDHEGRVESRRWQLRTTDEAETGTNVGSNLQLVRYSDAGDFLDMPMVVSRATGNVTLAGGFIARRATASISSLSLNSTSLGGGIGVIGIGNATTPPENNPTGGGVLYAEGGALKWRGSAGTVTTLGPA